MIEDLAWLIILLTAAGLLLALRQRLLGPMLWGAVVSLPILLLPVIFFDRAIVFSWYSWHLVPLLVAIVKTFLLGATAAGGYELLLQPRLALTKSSRRALIWLLVGPLVLGVTLVFGGSVVAGLMVAVIADFVTLVWLRKNLFWDALFAGVMMAGLYIVGFYLFYRGLAVGPEVWAPSLSGVTLGGVALEQLLIIVWYGALWGPVYVGLKDRNVEN